MKAACQSLKYCWQFAAFTVSFYPFFPQSRGLKPQSSWFFSQLLGLNENPAVSLWIKHSSFSMHKLHNVPV